MSPERWKQADRILQSSLERSPQSRDAFLRNACAGDDALESEVRSLLAAEGKAGEFLENRAIDVVFAESAVQALAVRQASHEFPVGTTIAHYRIAGKLGEGGMGIVYKAEDTRLKRLVALKFLSADFAGNAEALARFGREARTASALNHPNICTIHDIGEQDGHSFFVMEFLDGSTLKDRIAGRPMELDSILALGGEIADALDAAHSRGIIHRDLKAANIFVNSLGHGKILDFGLAKLSAASGGPLRGVEAAMVVEDLPTSPGSVLGTVSYMSPEQIRARPLDTRTDLFSFGVVLYEMATGKLPFRNESSGVAFEFILNRAPVPATQLNPRLPAELERIIGKCLEKDRELRYQHGSEIRADLESLRRGSGSPLTGAPTARTRHRRAQGMFIAAAATVLATIAAGTHYFNFASHSDPKLTEKDTIVLADFANKTGDPVFDETLRQGLAIQLQQSPFLSLISDEKIQRVLPLMGQAAAARLTPAVARDLCERTGSAAVLEGSIANLGSQYVMGLRAKSCRNGDMLAEEQAQAAKKEDVLNGLSQMAATFRVRLGESLAMVAKHSTPLEEASTASLEALKAYSQAMKVATGAGRGPAATLFKRATEIDPQFAMAYARLGLMYMNVGEMAPAMKSITSACRLRARASDAERFAIDALYDIQVTGNLERARKTCEDWEITYPRERDAHGFLSAMIYSTLGDYQRALEEGRKVIEIDPDAGFGYLQIAFNNTFLDRLEDSDKALRRADERKLHIPEFLAYRYVNAFLRSDKAGMAREITLSQGKPGEEDWLHLLEAITLGFSGQLQKARIQSQRAVDLALLASEPERAATFLAAAALAEAFFGNRAAAGQRAMAALKQSTGRDVAYGAAVALALAGDLSTPQKLARDLDTRFPEDTAVQFMYLPVLRALLELNDGTKPGTPAKAIELLQKTTPYELGTPPSAAVGFFGSLYPIYARGLAYLAAHKGTEAAGEFRRLLDHRTIVVNDPIGALAHLQLGRALLMTGDTARAKTAYQDFLTLWKDADPDIPTLQQAKAEFARLR